MSLAEEQDTVAVTSILDCEFYLETIPCAKVLRVDVKTPSLNVAKVLSAVSTNDLRAKTQCSGNHRAYRPLSQHRT